MNLPHLSHPEIWARAHAKRRLVLDWLAGGECYSTAQNLAKLLELSRPTVHDLLSAMERDGLLQHESVDASTRKIWGVTPHGIALSSVEKPGPHFERGRVSAGFIQHHLDTQKARLQAEANGWIGWMPGKLLYDIGLKKIPDAVATTPASQTIAIEIERTIKTPKRYAEIIPATLMDVKAGRYAAVHYISPQGHASAIERALRRVEKVKVGGETVKLTDAHFTRFSFHDLSEWPPSS